MFIAVYDMYQRCELHDVWPCGICNGDEKRLEESLKNDWDDSSRCLAPGIYLAQFPGHCANCGQNFGMESPIRYDNDAAGWVSLGCCG